MNRGMIVTGVAAAMMMTVSVAAHGQTGDVAAAPPAKEKKRCRSQTVTGSLVRKTRICMTEREWAREREKAQSFNTLTCSDQTVCAGT